MSASTRNLYDRATKVLRTNHQLVAAIVVVVNSAVGILECKESSLTTKVRKICSRETVRFRGNLR